MVTLDTGPADGPLLDRLSASPRPAVVQYWPAGGADSAGEDRIELSGRVVANWAAKTANLLDVEGLSAGSRVVVDLPADWKSLAVVLGVLWTGAEATLDPARPRSAEVDGADAVLTDRPQEWAEHPGALIAVSSGAHDTDFGAALPAHALDFSAEVRQQADQFLLPAPDLSPASLPGLAHDDGAPGPGAPVDGVEVQERGTAVAADGRRLTFGVLRAAVAAWDRLAAVVLFPALDLGEVQHDDRLRRALSAEGLRPPA